MATGRGGDKSRPAAATKTPRIRKKKLDDVLRIIEQREALLRSILETAPDAIITINSRGIVQSFSNAAERLFGYTAGEVIGNDVAMLMASPHRENHADYMRRYLKTGEKRIIGIGRRVEARRKDGAIFPIELAVGEVRLKGTRLFTGFIRDLTQRARLEQELLQAQKMEALGQLTGGLAHDFNNLLTVISGNLEMLESRLQDPSSIELLGEAREATALGAQLATRLTAFGRRQHLVPKTIGLNALTRSMTDLIRRTLVENLEVECTLAETELIVRADPGQLENALLNLAINARDAMPDGGKLMIETARRTPDALLPGGDASPGGFAALSVTDTGCGMSAEVRDRAFEPFFTTKQDQKGSGLGLSMVYGFVKQSGGQIELLSEPGLGTTVRMYLPIAGEAAEPASATASNAGEASRRTSLKILVVEDDSRVRRVVIRRLKDLGHEIFEAETAPAALRLLQSGCVADLLLSDVMMPGGMSGIELAEIVSQRWPEMKIILMSGYADPEKVKQASLGPGVAWLAKPFTRQQLQAKLAVLSNQETMAR